MMNLFGRLIAIKQRSNGSLIEVMFLTEFTKGLFVEYVLNPELLLECYRRTSCASKPFATALTAIRLDTVLMASLSSIKKPAVRAS